MFGKNGLKFSSKYMKFCVADPGHGIIKYYTIHIKQHQNSIESLENLQI